MRSATLHKLCKTPESSFIYRQWECSHFDKPWHYHKEYELVLINRGEGMRFIGDNVTPFQHNDLTFIGPDIPHLYRNYEDYYEKIDSSQCKSTFIHFTREFLGDQFFQIPEMLLVKELLDKSLLALQVEGSTKKYIIDKLNEMNDQHSPQRVLSLLQILIKLAESQELNPLLSYSYNKDSPGNTEKINTAFEFILKNYTEKIYAEDIASKLNMSTAAFSRYFKRHTCKTFTKYVTEVRIGRACRLLMEKNYSVSEICYRCGFENQSNFYRHFKKIVGKTPAEYRNRFLIATT